VAQIQLQIPRSPLSSSGGANRSLSSLTRDLEFKRQKGQLTTSEVSILRSVDDLIERVANYNQGRNSPAGHSSAVKTELDRPKDLVIIPQISAEDADQIIRGINDQFQEKVLSQIKHRHERVEQVVEAETNSSSEVSGIDHVETGRNLQDHLAHVRLDRPAIPFADEDSQIDLEKIKYGRYQREN